MASALMAEFGEPGQLAAAVTRMRERGYRRLETYTPYQTEEVTEALGEPRSRLPWAIFVGGLIGAGGAYGLQWLVDASLYPVNVGGRPPHFPLAFVPITFEMGVLVAGFTALIGVLLLARSLNLWDPVFELAGFERASIDRFWLRVDATDKRFHMAVTRGHLEELAPLQIVELGEGRP